MLTQLESPQFDYSYDFLCAFILSTIAGGGGASQIYEMCKQSAAAFMYPK